MLFGFTLEEEMYERPCIVDDSKNSRKISIFTCEDTIQVESYKEEPFIIASLCVPHF